jgi:3',5'-cyclic AMP phosphodiesterase CpdA
MRPILHLSDTHFGTETPAVVEALVAMAKKASPRLVLLSGDITQRARKSQFAAARRFVDRLQAPVVAIPGNHDIPLFNVLARATAPYGGYRQFFGPALEPVLDDDHVLVVGVNSTRASRHKNGEVSADQVAWASRHLRRARPEQLRVVMLHHPVLALQASDEENVPSGREMAVQEWVAAGVDLILGGHIHLPYVLPLSQAESGSRRAWAVQAGTAVSSRVRNEISNSVNLIHYGGHATEPECRIEQWNFDLESGEFQCVGNVTARLSRA